MRFHFPIIIIDEDFRSENASGLGIRALADAIAKEGMEVLGVTSYGDLSSFAQQQSRGSAFILSVDDEELVCKFFWELLNEGIYTNPVLAPAVTHSLIRISCMATHTDEHAERLLETMYRVGKKLELVR